MKRTFLKLSRLVPSLASLSASAFPKMPEWPLTHLKVVQPICLLRAFTMGHMRLAWAEFAKSELVRYSRSLQRVFIAHWESVLMWRWLVFGVSVRALWIASSSPVLLDWDMFFPTGVALFLGSFGPNQMPIPAWVLVLPLRRHDLLVKMMVL